MTEPKTPDLRDLLITEHRRVVAEYSANMAGHVAIRDGWLTPDPDTGWAEETIEPCEVCDAITQAGDAIERAIAAERQRIIAGIRISRSASPVFTHVDAYGLGQVLQGKPWPER